MIDKAKRIPGYVWRHRYEFKHIRKYLKRQVKAHTGLLVFAIFGVLMLRLWWGSFIFAIMPHLFVFFLLHLAWKWKYLKKIEAEGADNPGQWELIKAWWFETKRLDQGRRVFHQGCVAFGLTPPNDRPAKGKEPTTPALLDPVVDLEGDLESPIAPGRVFVPMAKMVKVSADLAEAIGCKEIVITPDYDNNGCGTIKMYWSNPLARTIKIKNLPYGKNYSDVVIGRTMSGTAATVSWEAGPVWLVGITGSGKSGIIWNMIADLRDRDVPYLMAVSDPKGGMEMRKLKDSPRVVHFAKNPQETVGLVNEMVAEMRRRQPLIESRKLTVPTEDFPLWLIPLDEIITCMPLLMAQGQTRGANAQQAPIIELLNECRSALMFPVLASQTGHADIVGSNRNLIPQRVLLRVASAATIGTVIDTDKADVRAHLLHPLRDRGIGWVQNEHGRLEKFRAGLITEAEIDQLARDEKIKGMTRESRSGVKKAKKDNVVYHAFSKDKIGPNGEVIPFDRIEYIGRTNDMKRRAQQHYEQDYAYCKEHKQWEYWWRVHVDPAKMLVEGKYTQAEANDKIEKEAIENGWPVWNIVHNLNNPVAKAWGRTSNEVKAFPTRIRASRAKTREQSNDDLTWTDDLDREAAEMIDSERVPAVVTVEGEVETDEPVTPDGPPPKIGRIRSRTPLPPIAPMMILAVCFLASVASGIGLT